MLVESVHVYTLISGALFGIFAAFFLSSVLCSKFLGMGIGLRGAAAYALACTIALFTLMAVMSSMLMPPIGMSVGVLLGLFAIHFVLTKKLMPRLARGGTGPSTGALPSALRVSLVSAPMSAVFLLLAGIAVPAAVFA